VSYTNPIYAGKLIGEQLLAERRAEAPDQRDIDP